LYTERGATEIGVGAPFGVPRELGSSRAAISIYGTLNFMRYYNEGVKPLTYDQML
jgi:hypothetical protein